MTLPPQSDANPQRSATRAPVEVDVRVQFDDSLEVYVGRCFNISIGGMFLEVDHVRPHGSLVRFEVGLEEGSVRGLAEVVWSQGPLPGRSGGLGLKFRFLEQRDRQLIFKLVSQHIKDRLAQRPPLADEPPSPNTALARQRRASMLGEGLPAPTPPTLATTSSIPRLAPTSLAEEPESFTTASPLPASAGRVMDERFPSTPVADDLLVRTGASAVPILREETTAQEAPIAGRPGLEERTWPSARPVDPAWLTQDQAAEDEPWTDLPIGPAAPEDDLGFGRPTHAAPAFDAEEDDDPGERHYFDALAPEPRRRAAPPKRRMLPLVIVLLLVLSALGYFLGTRLWHQTSGEAPPEEPAEVLRIGTSPPPPATQPLPLPAPVPATVPAGTGDGAAATPEPALDGDPPAPTSPSPVPEPTPAPPVDPPPLPAAEDSAATRSFRRIVDIRWNKIPDGVEVIIEADGPLPEQRYDRFRLEGATPREVIRFYGVEKRFESEQLVVGSIYLQQIRLGWHTAKPKGNELHVVLDVGNNARIHQVRNLGNALSVQVKKR